MELTVLQKLKQDIQQSEILSADTKIIVSAFIFNALENEKKQIKEAVKHGLWNNETVDIENYSEIYYNETFKND